MSLADLHLTSPHESLETAFLAMVREYATTGDDHYQAASDDYAAYLAELRAMAAGVDLRAGLVASRTFWAIDGAAVAGVIRLRERLTPALEDFGGHIGYDVRPSLRRRGYATRMLALLLDHARNVGYARILLTCDAANVASARVILKNGGRLASEEYHVRAQGMIQRYWIDL